MFTDMRKLNRLMLITRYRLCQLGVLSLLKINMSGKYFSHLFIEKSILNRLRMLLMDYLKTLDWFSEQIYITAKYTNTYTRLVVHLKESFVPIFLK